MSNIRDTILETGALQRGYFKLAGGDYANNKLDLEVLHYYPEVEGRIAHQLGRLAMAYEPDVLVPIPKGGNNWAELIADEIKKPVVYLRKQDVNGHRRGYDFATEAMEGVALRNKRLLIIDDVGTRLTSLKGVLRMPAIRERAVGMIGIWLRGKPDLTTVPIPTKWVVNEFISTLLPENSPMFKQPEYEDRRI